MALLLLELYGSHKAARLPARVLIGRRSMNHLVIESTAVSRMHAWIDRVGGGFVLTDMTSRTGTFVNGVRLVGSRPLADKDVIQIGPARLTFLQGETPPLGFERFEIPRQPTLSDKDVGIRFDCPHCRAPMWAAPQFAGNVGTCAYCGEEFTIPGGSVPASEAAPVALEPDLSSVGRIVPRRDLQVQGTEPVLPPIKPPKEPPPASKPATSAKPTVTSAKSAANVVPPVLPAAVIAAPTSAAPFSAAAKAPTIEVVTKTAVKKASVAVIVQTVKPPAPTTTTIPVALTLPGRPPDSVRVVPDAGTLSAAEGISRISPGPKPRAPNLPAAPVEPKPVRPAAPPIVEKSNGSAASAPPAAKPIAVPRVPSPAPTSQAAAIARPIPAVTPPVPEVTAPAAVASASVSPVAPIASTIELPTRPRSVPEPVTAPPEPVAEPPAVLRPSTSPLSLEKAPPAPEKAPPTPAVAPKAICGVCQTAILPNEVLTRCTSCGLAFHEECWQENYGCSAYGCNQTNILKPPEPEPDAHATPLGTDEDGEWTAVDHEPPPGTPWEFALLGVSALAALASGVSFGAASLIAFIVTGRFYLKTRRSPYHKSAPLLAAMGLSVLGIIAGAAVSYLLFLNGPKRL